MTLKDKHVVVLGGTSGIGLAVAQAAGRAGAAVTVASSRQESVDRALAALPAGSRGEALPLTDPDAVARLFAGLGPIDHLVYTAGEALTLGKLAGLDLGQARQAFEVRLWGMLAAVQQAVPHIRAGGSITLTTGIAKDRPRAGWVVAAAICGATDAVARALAVELAPVRVNIVSPGVVRTPLWNPMDAADRDGMYSSIGAALPVGRIGEAEDVAQAYLYLMQEGYSTGQTVTVDGGSVLV